MILKRKLIDIFRQLKLKKRWRSLNENNLTEIRHANCIDNVSVGIGTYGDLNIQDFGNGSKLKIGNYCSIAHNCTFVLGGEHPTNNFSTYPFKQIISGGEKKDSFSKGDIIIENDVWIGENVTIISGTHIGQGAVIGACSLVTGFVEPYAIVGGVPAKTIKYRFSKKVRDCLLKEACFDFDYKRLSQDELNLLYKEISDDNIKEFLNQEKGLNNKK